MDLLFHYVPFSSLDLCLSSASALSFACITILLWLLVLWILLLQEGSRVPWPFSVLARSKKHNHKPAIIKTLDNDDLDACIQYEEFLDTSCTSHYSNSNLGCRTSPRLIQQDLSGLAASTTIATTPTISSIFPTSTGARTRIRTRTRTKTETSVDASDSTIALSELLERCDYPMEYGMRRQSFYDEGEYDTEEKDVETLALERAKIETYLWLYSDATCHPPLKVLTCFLSIAFIKTAAARIWSEVWPWTAMVKTLWTFGVWSPLAWAVILVVISFMGHLPLCNLVVLTIVVDLQARIQASQHGQDQDLRRGERGTEP